MMGGTTLPVAQDYGYNIFVASWAPQRPAITWSGPGSIVYGTALGSNQLNATANVPGKLLSYSPPVGTILRAGNNQTLSVTFTSSDITDCWTGVRVVNDAHQRSTSDPGGDLAPTGRHHLWHGSRRTPSWMHVRERARNVYVFTGRRHGPARGE